MRLGCKFLTQGPERDLRASADLGIGAVELGKKREEMWGLEKEERRGGTTLERKRRGELERKGSGESGARGGGCGGAGVREEVGRWALGRGNGRGGA